MSTNPDTPELGTDDQKNGDFSTKSVSRRRLIKGAIATAPFIATLPTGAALARSSNVITSSSEAGAKDVFGRTLCMDDRSGVDYGTAIDLGPWPHGSVNAITDRKYFTQAAWRSTPVSEGYMCKQGGGYYYWNYGWKQVKVPRGMLVSATAIASFAGGIKITEI